MFCSNCGTNNPDGVRFCSSCGNPMSVPAQPVYTPPVVTPALNDEEATVAMPVEPVYAPPVEPVVPVQPVYAPVEPVVPVAPAPAPAPAPKKNGGKGLIIAIIAIIAVIGITVGALFATGVIGGDGKKGKAEKTTENKTEESTEPTTDKEIVKYRFKNITYGNEEYVINVDEQGEPIRGNNGMVFVCEMDSDGLAKYDENQQLVGKWRSFEDGFNMNGYIYYPHTTIKLPTGWTHDGSTIINENNTQVFVIQEVAGEDVGLIDMHEAFMGGYEESFTGVITLQEGDLTLDGYDAKMSQISGVSSSGITIVSYIYTVDVNGTYCYVVFAKGGTQSFDADTYINNNVTFNE